jgi:2-keto-4-pentenoate hydratase
MNRLKASATSQLQRWASRQLADYDAWQPGTMFADGVMLDVAQGYELQSAVAQLRCGRGEQVIGYKVGCTSSIIRAQLGIDHCVTGRLYDSEQHSSGAVLSRRGFANLAIEGELAVELSHEPTEKDFAGADVPVVAISTCVARVFPVIELHNQVMRGDRPSAAELIANNAIHAGFVAGNDISPDDMCGLEPALSIFADDRLLDECAGPALIQTINSSLKWLTEVVRDRGDRLRAGQIILTGSIPSLIPIAEDCGIRVDAPPFGSVEAEFRCEA